MKIKKSLKIVLVCFGVTIFSLMSLFVATDYLFYHVMKSNLDLENFYAEPETFIAAHDTYRALPFKGILNGCYVSNDDNQLNYKLVVNQNDMKINIEFISNDMRSFFPVQATATYEMNGSALSFTDRKGAVGLLSNPGWIIETQEAFPDTVFAAFLGQITRFERTNC